jgi:hypothetical protein
VKRFNALIYRRIEDIFLAYLVKSVTFFEVFLRMSAPKLVNKRESKQSNFSVLRLSKRPPLLRSRNKGRVTHLNSDKKEDSLP